MQEVILTEEKLKELCAVYQRILRLQDWHNKVKVARGYDFDKQNCQGQVRYTLARKEALIYILAHADYEPSHAFPQDMEVTLVHELLHLHFAEVSDKCEEAVVDINTALEQGIQSIAEAIVTLRRQAGEYSTTGPGAKEEPK